MPKFNRISLVGSEELFRPTKVDSPDPTPRAEPAPADFLAGRESGQAAAASVHTPQAPAPLAQERANYRLHLSEAQLRVLLDAVQRMKYPAQAQHSKPSIEEFEALEQLRNTLFDALD